MQQQEFDKATEYLREMKRMAEISDINHIYKQNYNTEHSSNTNRNNFNTSKKTNNVFNLFNSTSSNNNNDISLILALILLLSNDGGDKMLILALLYIMS